MGAGGVPNRSVEIVEGSRLERNGKPNSRTDRFQNGRLKQQRWYDKNGRAVRNRDFEHGNGDNSHFFPHDHEWSWNNGEGVRGHESLEPDYDNYN